MKNYTIIISLHHIRFIYKDFNYTNNPCQGMMSIIYHIISAIFARGRNLSFQNSSSYCERIQNDLAINSTIYLSCSCYYYFPCCYFITIKYFITKKNRYIIAISYFYFGLKICNITIK